MNIFFYRPGERQLLVTAGLEVFYWEQNYAYEPAGSWSSPHITRSFYCEDPLPFMTLTTFTCYLSAQEVLTEFGGDQNVFVGQLSNVQVASVFHARSLVETRPSRGLSSYLTMTFKAAKN